MSRKITDILNLRPAALPSSPIDGEVASDSGDGNRVKFRQGGVWVDPSEAALDVVTSIAFGDSPYTLLTATNTLLVDTSGGAVTVNLYTGSGNIGRRIKIIKTTSDTNAITVDGNASETINGNLTTTLNTQWEELEILIISASAWYILNRKSDTTWANVGDGTLTLTGTGASVTQPTVVNLNRVRWRRVGRDMITRLEWTANSTAGSSDTGAADYLFTVVPSGYTIDTTEVTADTLAEGAGAFVLNNSVNGGLFGNGSASGICMASVYSTTQVRIGALYSGQEGVIGETFFGVTDAGAVFYNFTIRLPITGWKAGDE